MAWTIKSTPVAWNVTDSEMLDDSIYHLMENAGADAAGTFATAQFTTTQLLNAFNDRQRRFMRDTGSILVRATEASTPGTARYTLPTDWVSTRRLTWQSLAGNINSLERSDAFELDHSILGAWETNAGTPLVYHDATLPTLEVELTPAPANIGTMEILYTALSTLLDGTGVKLSIPDEFAPGVKWGAIGDLLKQDAEGNDPQRVTYCEMRYDLCVEMARLLLEGMA